MPSTGLAVPKLEGFARLGGDCVEFEQRQKSVLQVTASKISWLCMPCETELMVRVVGMNTVK